MTKYENNLTQDFEIVGEWHLPDSEEKIAGLYRFQKGQSTIQLSKPIVSDSLQNFMKREEIDTIHGNTSLGKVTLTHVHLRYPFNFGSVYTAIFGSHLDSQHTLEGISCSFEGLTKWTQPQMPSLMKKTLTESLTEDRSKRISFEHAGNTCMLFAATTFGANVYTGIKISPVSKFSVKTKEGKSFNKLFDYVQGFRYFLQLIMGTKVELTEMAAYNFDVSRLDDRIFLPVIQENYDDKWSDQNYFFHLKDIESDFPKILKKWFDFYFNNKYMLKIFFETFTTTYIESTDFFVQAPILDGFYISEKSDDDSKYVDRLRHIFSVFESDFSNLDDFITTIVDMRKKNLHFKTRVDMDETVLHQISHDLHFMIRILFLKYIDIDILPFVTHFYTRFLFLKSNKQNNSPKN